MVAVYREAVIAVIVIVDAVRYRRGRRGGKCLLKTLALVLRTSNKIMTIKFLFYNDTGRVKREIREQPRTELVVVLVTREVDVMANVVLVTTDEAAEIVELLVGTVEDVEVDVGLEVLVDATEEEAVVDAALVEVATTIDKDDAVEELMVELVGVALLEVALLEVVVLDLTQPALAPAATARRRVAAERKATIVRAW